MSTALWKRALFGGLLTLGFFIGLELAMRAVLGPPPAAIAVYSALGAHESYLDITDGQATLRVGRGDVPAFSARSDAPRVAVLGGSSVHGGSPNVHHTREFSGRLATALDVEVVNLGSPGLDSHDVVRLTRELSAVDLSAVVVYTGHNDFGNAFFEQRYGSVSAGLFARVHGALSHLQLFAQLSRVLRPTTGTDRRARPGMAPQQHEVQTLDAHARRLAVEGLAANLEQVAWMTHERDVPVVMVVPVCKLTSWPGGQDCAPGTCPADRFAEAEALAPDDPAGAVAILRQLRDTDPVPLRAPTVAQDAVRDVASRWDHITLVDPSVALDRDPVFDVPHRRLFIDPVHFSPDGHRAMAELLDAPVRAALTSVE